MNNTKKKQKLILGTAQMGLNYGINNFHGMMKAEESFNVLNFAFDNGIRNLDSAESYGDIHKFLGSFYESNPEKKFKIHTKISFDKLNESYTEKTQRFLSELKISKIQTLMFHSYLIYKKNINFVEDCVKLKDHGTISKIGVSVYQNKEIEDLLNDNRIDTIQIPFNMLDNSNEKIDLIKKARQKGKIIQARSVFLQGLFFKKSNDQNNIFNKLDSELNELKSISINNKISLYQMALNYVICQDFIDYVVIGVDNLSQLKKNINSLDVNLENKVVDQIKHIDKKNKYYLNPNNW